MSANPPSGPAAIERAPRQINLIDLVGRYAPTLFLLVLIIVLSILEPAFRTETNLFQVMRQISITGIIAVGMTFVILTGGIDLSVGSVLAFSGIVGASAAKGTRSLISGGVTDRGGVHVLYGALAAVGVGLAIGVIQGFVIAKMRVPPFVATLGGLGIWRGATLVWSNGEPISSFSKDFTYWGKGFVGRVPVPVIFFVGLVVVGHVVLRYTRYGRWIYALGGNPEAARLSGLNTTGLTMSVYVISGFCAGLGGFLLTSRLNSAEQIAGQLAACQSGDDPGDSRALADPLVAEQQVQVPPDDPLLPRPSRRLGTLQGGRPNRESAIIALVPHAAIRSCSTVARFLP